MKRLAVFVEGKTEVLFVEKLLTELAGEKRIAIESWGAVAVSKGRLRFRVLRIPGDVAGQEFFVVIYDCGNDETVASTIRDQYESLVKGGHELVLGLRDVYPRPHDDIPKLEREIPRYLPTGPVPVRIMLAVMEIEAWFLAETSHFARIHESLTLQRIKDELGIDLVTEDVEQREHPSEDLNRIYELAGGRYTKKGSDVQIVRDMLDYGELYLTVRHRVKHLDKFITALDSFLG